MHFSQHLQKVINLKYKLSMAALLRRISTKDAIFLLERNAIFFKNYSLFWKLKSLATKITRKHVCHFGKCDTLAKSSCLLLIPFYSFFMIRSWFTHLSGKLWLTTQGLQLPGFLFISWISSFYGSMSSLNPKKCTYSLCVQCTDKTTTMGEYCGEKKR